MLTPKYLLTLISFFLLQGCATNEVTQNKYHSLAVSALQDIYIEGVYDVNTGQEALRLATLSGDINLQWKAYLGLCHSNSTYCDNALELAHTIKNDTNNALFETYVVTFLAHQEPNALEAANAFAKSFRQKSIVLILQGKEFSIDGDTLSPQERAVILFHLGKHQKNIASLELASQEFFRLENFRGSADASFLAAQYALDEGDNSYAHQLALKSKRLLLAVQRQDLATAVDTWVQANL